MEQLNISLFDPLQIISNDELVSDFRTKKVLALLVYLAAQPDTAHRRETLMALLWPGMPDTSARANLRQVLFHLRQAIPDFVVEDTAVPLLISNRHTIQLNPTGSLFIDTVQFEALLSQIHTHDHLDLLTCHKCREDLAAATSLYTGHFLADFYLEDSNEFEEWAEIRRQNYQRKTLDALETLTTIAIRQQAYAEARLQAERQLEIDDLRESAYQQLMEILARNGQRNDALAVYEKCRRHLMEELGMAPATRTTALYEKILAGDLRLDSMQEQGVRGYELQDEIGAGAYGVIHRAMQPAIGREVAVKIIRRRYANDPAFIRRFEAEAQTIARLEHPYIVPLYDYWRDPDGAYLVMRLLRGGNLLTALENGPWSLERTQNLLDQISAALAAAHSQGIVHRDIKPANILFDESRNAYLSDFGIAKDLQKDGQFTIEGTFLGSPDYISPEQLQEAPVSPQSDIYSLGAVLYEVLTGEKPFPDVPLVTIIQNHLSTPFPLVSESRPDLPAQIDAVIGQATAKRPSDRFPDVLTLAEAFRQSVDGRLDIPIVIEQTPLDADIPNPYKGLRAFQEADALDFFGRDTLTSQLIEHLSSSQFLAIVGPSGSGKSSVVKAGMIPALRQGAIRGSDKWFVAEMVPGTHPLEELELALWPIAVDPPPSLVEPMQRDPRGMLRTIRRILPNEEDAHLLLVIDQFEELWSLTPEDRRQHFLDSLLAMLAAPHSPLRVIITLRADFYDRPLQYQLIAELFKQHTELVLPLTRDELTWAIQEPARRVGVEFDDTVLPAMVAGVDEQPGALPLLQYALTELFDARSESRIMRNAYDEIGGVLGALPRRADEIFNTLSLSEKVATRQFFMRLITLGEGVEDTRRRVLLSELEAINLENERDSQDAGNERSLNTQSPISEISNRFGAARLLTFDHDPLTRQPTVEVAHEALLREWGHLRTWLDESRDDIRLQRLLATAVSEWQLAGQNKGFLLQGARLSQYEMWATETTVALTAEEQRFLTASGEVQRQQEAAEEARLQRELETAQQLAETEHRRAQEQVQATRNLRRRAVYLGVALVVAALLALAAIYAGIQANDNAQTAVANANIAATQEALAAAQADEAQISANLAATAEAKAEEERTLAQKNEAAAIAAEDEAVTQAIIARFNEAQAQSLALTTNARRALNSGDLDLAVALAVEAANIEQPPAAAVRTLIDVAFAPGTRYIAEAGHKGQGFVEMSPDGRALVTTGWNQNLEIVVNVWDSISGEMLNQFEQRFSDISSLTIMPDSTRLAVGANNGNMAIWDLSTGDQVQTLDGLSKSVEKVIAGGDGNSVIAMANFEKLGPPGQKLPIGLRMIAWDIESGEEIYRLEAQDEWMSAAAVLPDGRTAMIGLATFDEQEQSTGEARLLIVDLETGEILAEPPIELTGTTYIQSLTVNPSGDQAFAMITEVDNSNASKGVLISLPSGEVIRTVELPEGARPPVLYSPDGSQITVGIYGYFSLLDAATGDQIRFLGSQTEGHFVTDYVAEIDTHYVLFTPDGSSLISGSLDSNLFWWDVDTGDLIRRLIGHEASIIGIKHSPDGQGITTVSGDGKLRFWDLSRGGASELQEIYKEFEGHDHWNVSDVDISPDGKKAVSITNGEPNRTETEAILWDTSTLEVIHRLPGVFRQAAFLPDGQSVILAGIVGGIEQEDYDNPEMLLVHWDVESGAEIGRNHTDLFARPWDMDVSTDGKSVLIAPGEEETHRFDIGTLTQSKRTRHWDGVNFSVAFHPDGRSALYANNVGIVTRWNHLSSNEEGSYPINRHNHGGLVLALAFSQDGERFLSASTDQTIVLWDVASGEAIRTFNGHTDAVNSVAFTPDESQIISGSADGTLILWDVASGEALRTFSEHSAGVTKVAVSPDGQLAYSAAQDGLIIVRPIGELPIDEVLTFVKDNRVLRNFTCEEREQYRILPLCDVNGDVPGSDN